MSQEPEEIETEETETLTQFAAEPKQDRQTLGRYIAANPQLQEQLEAFAIELWSDQWDNAIIDG